MSVHLSDIDNFYHEWDVDELPWDAVKSVEPGDHHPDLLDQNLVDAINERAIGPDIHALPHAKAAAVAFLYLYMILAHGDERFVLLCRMKYTY